MAGTLTLQESDVTAVRSKAQQTFTYQALAFLTVLALVVLERRNPSWGRPVAGIGAAMPLLMVLVIAGAATLWSMVGLAFSVIECATSGRRPRGLGPLLCLVDSGVRRVFLVDALGLLCLALISRGSAGLLSLFVMLTAPAVLVTCPGDAGVGHCDGCGATRRHSRIWHWLFTRHASRCRDLVAIASAAVVFSALVAEPLARVVGRTWPWTLNAMAPEQVVLRPWTPVVFASLGMVLILYSRWTAMMRRAEEQEA